MLGLGAADSTGVRATEDSTTVILSQPDALLLFNTELPGKDPSWKNDLLELYSAAAQKGIPFYFVTANRQEAINVYSEMGVKDVQALSCDFTAIRTAARSNPTLYLLKNGSVAGKWSYAKLDEAKAAISK